MLAAHFLHKHAREPVTLTPDALEALACYRWPGNVRELKAAVSSAALLAAAGGRVGADNLGAVQRSALSALRQPPDGLDDVVTIDQLEQTYVSRVLDLCGGNKVLAAQKLGISRQTLARWLTGGSET